MITATSKACRLTGKRQLRSISTPIVGTTRPSQDSRIPRKLPAPFPPLPPAQLLQYALTGSTKITNGDSSYCQLDRKLDELFSRESLPKSVNRTEPTAPTTPPHFHFQGTGEDILSGIYSEIQLKVEDRASSDELTSCLPLLRNALQRCESKTQWEDLLTTVNGILARLRMLGATNTKTLILLGMDYAARSFYIPALRQYFSLYIEDGHGFLDPDTAFRLANSLRQGLEMRILDNPNPEKDAMREVVSGIINGETAPNSFHALLDLSHPSDNAALLGAYVKLLGQLGDQQRLTEVWSTIRTELAEGRTAPDMLAAAAECLRALIKSTCTQAAVAAVQDMSHFVDPNSFIPEDLWASLVEHDHEGALRELASDKTIRSTLTQNLHLIETRLGLKWTGGGKGRHSFTRHTPLWCNNGSPDEAYELLGDENIVPAIGHLLEIFGLATSSRSMDSLSMIADLLNEYEGVEMPLCAARDEELGPVEFTWIMQCSPIDIIQPRDPSTESANWIQRLSTLGLLRVRQDCYGVPRKFGPHLHLMQLGYVGVRKRPIQEPGAVNPELEQSTATGHIICWDRHHGRIVILWVGKGYGSMHAGLLRSMAPSYFPYSCVETQSLADSKNVIEMNADLLSVAEIFGDMPRLWIDTDPAFDLHP